MLDQFSAHLKIRRDGTWLHWNMRDQNYGFQAIEHRHRVLGGEPEIVSDDRKVDLSALMVSLYGENYIGHPHLASLVEKNHITNRDFLNGEQEAAAFVDKQYLALHRSTLRKVYILCNIAQCAYSGTLKTNASWKDQVGPSFRARVSLLKEHPIYDVLSFIGALITIATGIYAAVAFLPSLISSIFP